jgi:hypothetical protein
LKFVFKNLKFLFSIEQVHDFTSINFKEAHLEGDTSIEILSG